VEQVKRFVVLPVFWEAGGDEVTLTMKLKRKVVAEKYAARIADLYREPPAGDIREPADGPQPASTT
jgi:long-subunit acyl-CoA synthetase (AMP-forming)